MAHLTEEEIRKIFKDEFESYYQRVFPTFVVSGGAPTAKHERSEYCMTTKSAQGVHFYEGGIAKIRANKNLERIADFTCRNKSEIHFLPFEISKQDIIEVIANFEQQKIKT